MCGGMKERETEEESSKLQKRESPTELGLGVGTWF